ncbi:MAG: HesA/MoeB/ThiF family protein [Chloroflexi bacterium]|nr:HesA/MoeB/ThiF family protein [Chloroflexota bacterium]
MSDANDRYKKQIIFHGLGLEGQARLRSSSVLIAGVGALGSTLAHLLVRAGVGRVRLVDRDRVELGNLHRQILFDEEDVAQNAFKAEAAGRKLRLVNSQVQIQAEVLEISQSNIDQLMTDTDLILDALDNIATRLILNDAAIRLRKPWIHCGVLGSKGTVLLTIPGRTPCLRCLFPNIQPSDNIPWLDTVGILGTIPTFAATLAANEALKFLSGNHTSLAQGMIQFDLWRNEFEIIPLQGPSKDCVCAMSTYE